MCVSVYILNQILFPKHCFYRPAKMDLLCLLKSMGRVQEWCSPYSLRMQTMHPHNGCPIKIRIVNFYTIYSVYQPVWPAWYNRSKPLLYVEAYVLLDIGTGLLKAGDNNTRPQPSPKRRPKPSSEPCGLLMNLSIIYL